MKTATAKDLRQKTAIILDHVRKGREIVITYQGRSVAILSPIEAARRESFNPVGFGMWRSRRDMRSVDRWSQTLRAPRHRG